MTPGISTPEFREKVQKHVAWAAVAPTTLRGMLDVGGRRRICTALANLDISQLSAADYPALLDRWTNQLTEETNATWGPVRKGLNLFLRDVAYNAWLRDTSRIAKHEQEMEVPLDGIVMSKLREGDTNLPKSSVKALTPGVSRLYQDAAADIARRRGIARVHLDLDWWAGRDHAN